MHRNIQNLALIMDAVRTSETLVYSSETTRRYIPDSVRNTNITYFHSIFFYPTFLFSHSGVFRSPHWNPRDTLTFSLLFEMSHEDLFIDHNIVVLGDQMKWWFQKPPKSLFFFRNRFIAENHSLKQASSSGGKNFQSQHSTAIVNGC
jgi:hypothetical protein